MHTHAPKETFKLSRTKEREREREREREKKRESVAGRADEADEKVAVLSFPPRVFCVACFPDSLKVSLSLWLLFVRFF